MDIKAIQEDISGAVEAAHMLKEIEKGHIESVKRSLLIRIIDVYTNCIKSGLYKDAPDLSFLFGDNLVEELQEVMKSNGIEYQSNSGIKDFLRNADGPSFMYSPADYINVFLLEQGEVRYV